MTQYYSIHAVCQLTSLSIRTLHYYDEINLLNSSCRSRGKHRLYSEKALIRLQQIIILKQVGFSLSQIKKILDEDHTNPSSLFKMQLTFLKHQAKKIKKAIRLLEFMTNQYESQQSFDWEIIIKIIQTIQSQKNKTNEWYTEYLTKNEIKTLHPFLKTRTKKWKILFDDLKKTIHVNPNNDQAKKIASKWAELAKKTYHDHPILMKKLWKGYQAGIIPDIPSDPKVTRYLSSVFNELFKKP